MGKKIVKASLWTCSSLLSLCNKAVTMVFAVFCIISGLWARTVLSEQETAARKTIKGKVLSGVDSTVLAKIRIYLGGFWLCPEYGVGFPCSFVAFDSVETDTDGNFETAYSEKIFARGASEVIFAKKDSANSPNFQHISISDEYILSPESDTSLTIYLKTQGTFNLQKKTVAPKPTIIKSKRGNNLFIKIAEWSYGKHYAAEIIDASGKLITSPVITTDGVLNWDTKGTTNGVYFLKIVTKETSYSTEILLND